MWKPRTALLIVLLLAFAINPSLVGDSPSLVDLRPALPYPPGIEAESLCGINDDLQDVELYDGTLGVSRAYVKEHQPSTLQLQWLEEGAIAARLPGHALGNVGGARWCSGTLVGQDLVLTAGHCFDVQKGVTGWISPFRLEAGNPVFARPSELATLLVANFSYQIDGETMLLRKAITFPVAELVEYRRGGLDYAFIRLGRGNDGLLPGDLFPMGEALTRPPVEAESLAVIQHPQGWPKKIEAGRMLQVSGSSARYDDIDTYGASSGSGVRDALGKVIAVHTHGGCNAVGFNGGVTTAAISGVSDEI